ncbi:MAG: hypothetical protein IT431_04270 [Phycisphaerales bacterium]|nr:hypothetical protein [Phycisphaerales bacterium]
MAKKARKKTARRKVAGRKAGGKGASRRGASLRGVTTTDLQAELKRRASELGPLEAKREALMAEVAEIDGEIAFLSAALGGASRAPARRAGAVRRGRAVPGRKRPRNEKSLEVALSEVLKGKTMGVTEVAEAVQKAGYRTTSPNFRTIVNQTLIRSELIKKIGRGAYTAK